MFYTLRNGVKCFVRHILESIDRRETLRDLATSGYKYCEDSRNFAYLEEHSYTITRNIIITAVKRAFYERS